VTDGWLVALVMAAAAFAIAAPVLGRAGWSAAANASMFLAAAAGVASFALAAIHTLRAARRRPRGDEQDGGRE
jgi:TRAP-type C4-dicarboxylate transport system permease small subunit